MLKKFYLADTQRINPPDAAGHLTYSFHVKQKLAIEGIQKYLIFFYYNCRKKINL